MKKEYFFRYDNIKNFKTIKENLVDYMRDLAVNKVSFKVEISEISKKPTNQQRAYYFAVVLPYIKKASESDGNDLSIDELDYLLRDMLNFKEELKSPFDGFTRARIKSLSNSKGDKKETVDYIDKCINWAGEFYGIEIPSPYVTGYYDE
ncbi:MAG: hypothetical protein AMJ43_07915 [Coxiella sp. DG_40]|nr:MAG: hypothetical protein AMJ43_07915 [Coxiella sp. DG_40]